MMMMICIEYLSVVCVCQSTVRASASVFGPCPFEKVSKRCDVTYRENHAIEESPFT